MSHGQTEVMIALCKCKHLYQFRLGGGPYGMMGLAARWRREAPWNPREATDADCHETQPASDEIV